MLPRTLAPVNVRRMVAATTVCDRPHLDIQISYLVVPKDDPLLHARSGVFRLDGAHHFPD